MSNDFLKTNTPEVWTKEVYRNELFMKLEQGMFTAEIEGNYTGVLKLSKIYLRLQMEVMEEKVLLKDENGAPLLDEAKRQRRDTLYGMQTPTFQKLKARIMELEMKWNQSSTRKIDPQSRMNNTQERMEIITEIEELLDALFHNNTVLGLNYKKKNDPMKAAYS